MSSIVALGSVTHQSGCATVVGGVAVSACSASSMNTPSVASVHGIGGRQSHPEKSPGCSRMCFSDAVVAEVVDMGIAVITGLKSIQEL